MFWKFIFVNVLLVLPNSRILATEAYNYNGGDNSKVDYPSDDDIIDYLKAQAYLQGNVDQQGLQYGNTGSNDDALKQDPRDNNVEAPTQIKNANSEGLSKAVVPPEAQVNSQASVSAYAAPGQVSALQQQQQISDDESRGRQLITNSDKQFIIIVAVAVSTSFVGLMLAGVCYYKFRKNAKAASDVEYPVYGVTGPVKERIPSPGDRKLAQSAQMYHYQHQKQQMIAMEKANGDMKHDASDDDSEEDNIEGDYTVYECPGLAPTGEMEVRNPLFRADDTPVTPGEDITGHPHGQDLPHERGNQ